MITTLKQAKERINLCYKRFGDSEIEKDFKLWESFVKWTLEEKIKNKELI